jgi:hypothetical protein
VKEHVSYYDERTMGRNDDLEIQTKRVSRAYFWSISFCQAGGTSAGLARTPYRGLGSKSLSFEIGPGR